MFKRKLHTNQNLRPIDGVAFAKAIKSKQHEYNNTPNAPGPPSTKDGAKLSNQQHSSSSGSGGSSSGSGNASSGGNSSTIGSGSSSSSSNVLKSQLQSTSAVPSSLLTALSSGTSAVSNLLSTPSVSAAGPSSGSSSTLAAGEHTSSSSLLDDKGSSSPPPAKRHKCDPKDMVDVCVGTSVGTITEPDCLGPCEPGTSVTLEGIVWHETEGGVLVVNVTWRGKTYVGTLIDCTKHDWAPPRFCDSPTEEFDSRTPKGRGKRGRSSALFPVNDLSNFTETRSSMHSKLRNGGAKGRGGRGTTTTAESSSSKTTTTSTTTTASSEKVNNGTAGTQSVVNPMTGLNVQISTKKCKSTSSPCAISPVLLECPEQDCSKKYKHANGLRYHQSHAHGSISSMDEDSSQPPESPQRVAPPTTPSPSPTVQLSNLPTVPVTTTATATSTSSLAPTSTTASFSATAQVFTAVTLASNQNTTTTPTTAVGSTVASSLVSSTPALPMTESITTTSVSTPVTVASTASIVTPTVSSQHTTTSPATAAGGSITTGVAGSTQPHAPVIGGSTLLGSALAGNQNGSGAQSSPQIPTTPQQQVGSLPQTNNNGITSTPTRSDPNAKSKSGVLRFGPLPGDAPIPQGSSGIPNAPGPMPGGLTVAGNLLAMPPSAPGTPEGLNMKSQNCSKQKKNRKSPGPSEFDVAAANRAEDVQSPAYSDISDDSTPVVDPNDLDKPKGPQIQDITKKSNEATVGQMGPLSGYGMYPYYPGMPHQSPYYSAADHPGKPPGLGHSPLGPNASMDYKSKEPPLDLMNKPNPLPQQPQPQPPPSQQGPGQSSHPQQQQQQLPPPSGDGPGQPGNKDGATPGPPPNHPGASKMMQHFYPYGYMPAGFGYNLDPNYGPVSMISEESKLAQQQQQQQPPPQIKEERMKESPSPNEYTKMGPQMVPTKLIKSEPMLVKDIKTEGGHSMHPKDQPAPGPQPGQPSISAYGGGMFQRHGLNVGPPNQPPPQHMNRDEELRRLFNYPDQRRSGPPGGPSGPNMGPKDEPPSPSQALPGHPNHGSGPHGQPSLQNSSNNPQQQQQQQQQSQQKGSKNSSSSQGQLMKQQKDIKLEDKEMIKVKQEGQKPTMETQGPPPPPTSQYYPHSLYMSAAPFGFDPNHQMYRNMLVPTASYSAPPYHLQIPRYTTPEDLSRNPSTKALDLLQHHASQYYNSHKIHELREGALKSPTSNVKQPPGTPLQPSQGGGPSAGSNPGAGGGVGSELQKDPGGPGALGQKDARDSPPPQRHVHTHHHTHVGLGYPMFQAPYGAAVLASQQAAAAVTVISPFQTGPPAK
ncbi:hypothetical protein pipiens_017703 [Culex pipiens pipiens]|uniref:C2H2-type domain-containing protein n=1 Tax=Culex pipiens pipiens TaxID=38569 RepID=A0ABD1CFE3_CULPP